MYRSLPAPVQQPLKSVAKEPLSCDDPLTLPKRKMVFSQQKNENGDACEGLLDIGDGERPFFNINCKSYNHHSPAVALPFGQTEEWELSSENTDHPFHIHVNSFTVCPGSKVNGKVIETPRWMDTLFIRQSDTAEGTGVDAITKTPIKIRTRYEDYTGQFVMHCHKLNHEDEGMMQLLEIK